MPFKPKQIANLRRPLPETLISRLPGNAGGKADAPFLETHRVVDAANLIFEFGWTSQVLEHRVLYASERSDKPGQLNVGAMAIVRVTIGDVQHDGVGFCDGTGWPDSAYEMATKGAESDALKRALAHMGPQFGNSMRDKARDHRGRPIGDGDITGQGFAAAYERYHGGAQRPAAGPADEDDIPDEQIMGPDRSAPTPAPRPEPTSSYARPDDPTPFDGEPPTKPAGDIVDTLIERAMLCATPEELVKYYLKCKTDLDQEQRRRFGQWCRNREHELKSQAA
jgi:DNA recombination protein Rad52